MGNDVVSTRHRTAEGYRYGPIDVLEMTTVGGRRLRLAAYQISTKARTSSIPAIDIPIATTAPSGKRVVERDEDGNTGMGSELEMEHTVGEAAERVSATEVFVSEVLVLGAVVVEPDRLVMALVVLMFPWLSVSGGKRGPFNKVGGEEGIL